MRYNLFKVDRKEGVGKRGENSAEGPRLVYLEAEDRHGFSVPSSCLHPAESPSVPRGKPAPWRRG